MVIKEQKLKNGLLCVGDIMTEVNSIAMSIVVNTGSRFERPEQNGISHFLEHMAFKGTSTKTAKQIAEIFDDIGGSFNAYTSREATVYHGKVMKEDLQTLIEILSEIVNDMKLDEEEMNRERGVIIQEMGMIEDDPSYIIFDRLMEKCYPDQSFGRFIIGTEEHVNAFTKQDFQNYVDEHYYTENMMIVVAGNIDFDDFIMQAEKNFATYRNRPNVMRKSEKAIYKPGIYMQEKDLDQTHCVVSFPGFSHKEDERHAADVLSIILGGGMSSRLFQRIREELGLCYGISFGSSSYSDTGLLTFYTSVAPEKVNETIDNVAIELRRVIDDVSEAELWRAKKQVKSSFLMAMERNSFRLSYIKSCYTVYGKYVPMEELMKKIEILTINDMKQLMNNILQRGKITVALLGKLKNVYDYDTLQKKFSLSK